MDEPFGKTGPPVNVGEQFGDSEAREHTVEAMGDIVDIGVALPDRVDRESSLSDQRLGKFASRGECCHFSKPPLESLKTLIAPRFKAVGNRKPQFISFSLGHERSGRQQKIVEGPKGPTTFDPDISGTKPIPKRHHHSDLPGAAVNNGPCPNQLAPRRRQKDGRYPCWEPPLPGSVELTQHLKGVEQGIGRLPRAERESSENDRRGPVYPGIALDYLS